MEDKCKLKQSKEPRVGDKRGRHVGEKCKPIRHPDWETSVGDKCKLRRPKAPSVGDNCGRQAQVWETSVNSFGARNPD